MQKQNLAIVGVGLIGGSLGGAVRRANAGIRVLGIGRDLASVNQARERGLLDEATTDIFDAAQWADLMVFCTPVDRLASQVLEVAPHCKPGTVLTDVGSTKAGIIQKLVGRLPDGVEFVGAHPLAGSEKRGAEYADAELFRGRLVVITPTADNSAADLQRVRELWELVGARVKCLDPETHDEVLARTSHLPHLVAAALAGMVPTDDHEFTATGFRDTTRIAAGDPSLWSAIFEANRVAMQFALKRLREQLDRFESALADNDRAALEALLHEGQAARLALDGPASS